MANATKQGEVAKKLLNTGAMYALICADQYPCADLNKRVSVSFKGADHFKANIIRPVNAKEVANGNFIDGKDKIPADKTQAEVGTYMSIENWLTCMIGVDVSSLLRNIKNIIMVIMELRVSFLILRT